MEHPKRLQKGGKHMKYTISGKQMTVRPSLKELTEKKFAKFDRFFDDDTEAVVVYSCRHDLQYIELTIRYNGTIFRAEEGADSFQNAIDEAVESLERQIRKNKTRLEKKLREGAFASYAPDEEYEEEAEFDIRVKSFSVKPMSVEEAILQMNLLKHQFYVFRDDKTEEVCVVYARKNGGYGLIVPE